MGHLSFFLFLIIAIAVVIVSLFVYGVIGENQSDTSPSAVFRKYFGAPRGDVREEVETETAGSGGGGLVLQPSVSVPPPVNSESGVDAPVSNIPDIDPEDIPFGFSIEEISPHFEKIDIRSLSLRSSYDKISLRANLHKNDDYINITGWFLRSNRRDTYTIPQVIANYVPYGSSPKSDIKLEDGDVVNIYSIPGPLGTGLRLNMCTGYLEKALDFTPSLPLSCPRYDRNDEDLIATFKGECQDYINSLRRCETPDINDDAVRRDDKCQNYLEDINYGSCYSRNRSDPDFFDNEWRVWTPELGDFLDVDRNHDRILLFDKDGLLVDQRIY